MRNIIFITIFFVSVSSFIFALGSRAGKIDIGLAMPETRVERWYRDGTALKQAAEDRGYVAEVAYVDADQAEQNRQIKDFVTKGAKLLIIGSVNEDVAKAVAKAAAKDVAIIAYDRLITNSNQYEYYIAFDNYIVGQIQGKAIERALTLASGGKKSITLFAGSPTDTNSKFFFDGAIDVLRPYIMESTLDIVGPMPLSSRDSSFSRITIEKWCANIAKARMENILNGDASNVTLDVVLAPNDAFARAIIEALSADSKYAHKFPVVTGQDGEIASIKMIKDGRQYMTVFKDTRKLADAAIRLADDVLKGKALIKGDISYEFEKTAKQSAIENMRIDTTTYNTGKKTITSYLLAPVEVTKSNYKEIMIDSGYYTEDQLQ